MWTKCHFSITASHPIENAWSDKKKAMLETWLTACWQTCVWRNLCWYDVFCCWNNKHKMTWIPYLSPCTFGLANAAQCHCSLSHCKGKYSNFSFQSFGWTGRVRNRCTTIGAWEQLSCLPHFWALLTSNVAAPSLFWNLNSLCISVPSLSGATPKHPSLQWLVRQRGVFLFVGWLIYNSQKLN